MGIMMSDKRVNYSYGLAKIKRQVGQCIIEALLVHGHTKLTMAQTMGKPSPSPL
jgi:hypothetical protein